MRPMPLVGLWRSAACASVILAALLSVPQARAGAPASLDAEIEAARKGILANPLDAAAAARLTELRKQQKQRCVEALQALETGLEAYLACRWTAASDELKKAAACPRVASMADALLVRRLADVLRICQDKAAPAPGAALKGPHICPKCGNTGWADCSRDGCFGSGSIRCSTCDGRGKTERKLRPSSYTTYTNACPKCQGKGELECPTCSGKGVVRCTCGIGPGAAAQASQKSPAAPPQSPMGSNEAAAARKAIASARYLREGGIDLESPDALRCSPKLTK